MKSSQEIIEKTKRYGAHNYHPRDVVFSSANGVIVTDPEGREYIDMLSAYSSVSLGHQHPEIVAAAKAQLDRVTHSSRAFYNDMLADFFEMLCNLTNMEKILPMNTGAEAVETALKTARRWGVDKKGVPDGQQEIIVCERNFHGRTIAVISFSSDAKARRGFGPFTPGFKAIKFGDAKALEEAITPHTVAFLMEPIQGEAGVIIPPDGYLKEVRDICTKNNILMIADEIQTGFARTGKMFACWHEDIQPDIFILAKALGGGIMPVSAIATTDEIMSVFEPGSHGSTFGGNPFACAIAIKTMEIMVRDRIAEQSAEKGKYFLEKLQQGIHNDDIKEIRGRGLFVGIEFKVNATPYVAALNLAGVLTKETHEYTMRFAPPLVITYEQLDLAIERIVGVLNEKHEGAVL
ncbi:MAG: ornithine--oxo-acid transaminase [Symbiobacteriaceae bacterium]|nr:ornithine--oxo-acid transaminase [Symbiobacteriaceae bacterium]